MKIVRIDTATIVLTGITLASSFTIENLHEMLAVIFQIECKPSFLRIQPAKGMIMQKDKKLIRVRLKSECLPSVSKIQKSSNELVITSTYFSEYNKKMMEKYNLRGWSQISKQLQLVKIPIYFSYSSEIQKLKESVRHQRNKSTSSLKESRRTTSFQRFKQSSVKKLKASKINEDFDFVYSPSNYNPKMKREPEISKPIDSSKYSNEKQIKLNFENKITHRQKGQNQLDDNNRIRRDRSLLQNNNDQRSNRALQLIILAIIAAFCVGLGQSMARLLK